MSFTDSHGNIVPLPDGAAVAWRVSGYAVVKRNDSFLMVESGNGLWLFPGGGVEQHETVVDAAIRECLEETGYSVALDADQPFHFREQQFYHSREQAFYHSIQLFYRAKLRGDTPDIAAMAEHDRTRQVVWKTLDDLTDDNIHPTVRELVETLRN